MTVSDPNILYVNNTAWDLRKVTAAWVQDDDQTIINTRFVDVPQAVQKFNRITFETAWQASLNSRGGGGGGDPTLGGDLGGTASNGYVKTVRGLSSTLTYDGLGRLDTVTTAAGTKAMAYNPDGTLASIAGTGIYVSKVFTYSAGSLVSVTVS